MNLKLTPADMFITDFRGSAVKPAQQKETGSLKFQNGPKIVSTLFLKPNEKSPA